MTWPVVLPLVAVGLFAAIAWNQRAKRLVLAREHHIRAHVFPGEMLQALAETWPELERKDVQLVARALRAFFIVHARSRGATVGMPSKAVDALWHEFILDTRAYKAFCHAAFGGFFHHLPATVLNKTDRHNDALARTWRLACLEENIDPRKPTRLPLLFAIDAKLGIAGATLYTLESFKHIKPDSGRCGGGCGGGGSSSDGDGCSGGDGGGCGGGCGGD